jgi:hypothetical protein
MHCCPLCHATALLRRSGCTASCGNGQQVCLLYTTRLPEGEHQQAHCPPPFVYAGVVPTRLSICLPHKHTEGLKLGFRFTLDPSRQSLDSKRCSTHKHGVTRCAWMSQQPFTSLLQDVVKTLHCERLADRALWHVLAGAPDWAL